MSLTPIEDALELRRDRRLVFTNGVFDILHAGHVKYLEEAKQHGDLLFVGLNSDESVKTLNKGPGRPINTAEDRSAVLSALRCVDAVIAFDEPNPKSLIRTLKPEVHVKGGDYRIEDLPEAKIIAEYGGKVIILPFLEGRSTTNLLRKIGLE